MNNPWGKLVPLMMANLPANIDERRDVLDALTSVLPKGHDLSNSVRMAFADLNAHLVRQRELSLPEPPESPRGSVRLGDQKLNR